MYVGTISTVADLSLQVLIQHTQCSLNITWTPPYLLSGLTINNSLSIQYSNGTQQYVYTIHNTYTHEHINAIIASITVIPFNGSVMGDSTTVDTSDIMLDMKGMAIF